MKKWSYPQSGELSRLGTALGPFLERPDNFSGPKVNFEIKTSWIVPQFLAYKPVNFALLTDNFIINFNFINLIIETLILSAYTANIKQLSDTKSSRDFRETGPRAESRVHFPALDSDS